MRRPICRDSVSNFHFCVDRCDVPYAILLAHKGVKQAALDNPALAEGINVSDGQLDLADGVGSLEIALYQLYDHLK